MSTTLLTDLKKSDYSRDRISFLGLSFDSLTMPEILDRMEAFIAEGKPRQVFTPNAALVVWSHQNPYLKQVYDRTDMLTPDGAGVCYGSKLFKRSFKANVPAVSIFFDFLPIAEKKGYRLYFFGAKPGVVDKAVENVRRQYPDIQIVGFHHGHYLPQEEETIIQEMADAKPQVVFVAMSTPQKERFIDSFKDRIGGIFIGVGGTFDIQAGVTKLAPGWIRRSGLEWLYRLIQEPRRLWRRYATTHPAFIWLVIKAFVHERFTPNRRTHGSN